ncbi:hypothetical protein DSO57_1009820 [Entomophthora muscae]|uniref:Uncharacterized protein n=1 Tax=Entomophthora muscae TaxID=34485 RepID=A0ACC2RXV2_9FUNG|nr:hypothetical protein DSO57_1009820 [Entomophthora muscae]
MILYAEEDPKLYQVPAKPDMHVTFELPMTSKPLMKTMLDMRTRLQTAQKYYDSTLPKAVVDAKVNTIMRLLFQDGQDILNFLYNTPDEPCLPMQPDNQNHNILISNSSVTINYLSVPKMYPEEIHEPTEGENFHELLKYYSDSNTPTPSDPDIYDFFTPSSFFQGGSDGAAPPDSDAKARPTGSAQNLPTEKPSASVKKDLDYGVYPQHTPFAISDKPGYDDYPRYIHYESPEKPGYDDYEDDNHLEDKFWA